MRLADSPDTASDTYGDTLRYLDGRERVLGRRCVLSEDPSSAAETLAALHGGERRAASWLRQVLRQLDGRMS